ncbi:MAG: M23 family metallopeptidase [Flavobacteriaceae bacterium]
MDYFSNPIDGKIILSGTFAELRTNHFHSGIDIKTKGIEGLNVFSSAEGYVSRIKVSHFGYGKALYITHPNGFTTVYAHLKKFSPKIEEYVKSKQYEIEEYEIQLFPKKETLKINKSELIAFSGNTGGSSGPHLHFEIRDSKERPINPMLFGIKVDDSIKPSIYDLYAYPITKQSHVNGKNKREKIKLIKLRNGDYTTPTIEADGLISFGVIASDRQDYAMNKNGVSSIKSYHNSQKVIEINFDRFSFDETKHINRFIDFGYYKQNKKRIQKLFIEKNNPLSIFKFNKDKGLIRLNDNKESFYLIDIFDYCGNKTNIRIPIKNKVINKKFEFIEDMSLTEINAEKTTILGNDLTSVKIPSDAFYENVKIDFRIMGDTIKIHKPTIPLKKSIEVSFNVKNYADNMKHLFIGSVNDNGTLSYIPTKLIGNYIKAKTRSLGTYTIGIDRDSPEIKPINFTNLDWISNNNSLKIKISDKVSGIKNYRATVNGDWILMEYDPKTKTLTHDFKDGIIKKVENNLELLVTDNAGNSSKFDLKFYRKSKN